MQTETDIEWIMIDSHIKVMKRRLLEYERAIYNEKTGKLSEIRQKIVSDTILFLNVFTKEINANIKQITIDKDIDKFGNLIKNKVGSKKLILIEEIRKNCFKEDGTNPTKKTIINIWNMWKQLNKGATETNIFYGYPLNEILEALKHYNDTSSKKNQFYFNVLEENIKEL